MFYIEEQSLRSFQRKAESAKPPPRTVGTAARYWYTGLGSPVTGKSEVVALPDRLPDRLPTRNADFTEDL
eukprot:878518-Prorocentrum_minimum.AAC.8